MSPWMKVFAWLAGVLANPDDDQGSTARLCLFLIVVSIVVTLVGLVVFLGKYPEIPGSLSAFLLTLLTALIGKTIWDRKTEAGKEVADAKSGQPDNQA